MWIWQDSPALRLGLGLQLLLDLLVDPVSNKSMCTTCHTFSLSVSGFGGVDFAFQSWETKLEWKLGIHLVPRPALVSGPWNKDVLPEGEGW